MHLRACLQEKGHNAWTAIIKELLKISPCQQNCVGHYSAGNSQLRETQAASENTTEHAIKS